MSHAIFVALVVASMFCPPSYATPVDITPFSSLQVGQDPSPWRESRLRGKQPTEYRIVDDAGIVVIRADADASASALVHELHADTAEFPVLRWRWKIERVLDSSDISTRSGDDYPARVYVTFDHDQKKLGWFARNKLRLARLIYGDDVPAAALCYVWDTAAPEGTAVPNAYTNRVHMFVIRSGTERVGEWVDESRNVYEDYRAAFDEEPPMINSIVIATDTDDTGETATSWFGDLALLPRSTPVK